MKKSISRITTIFLLTSLIFFSCSKDDSPAPTPPAAVTPVTPVTPTTGTFTWTENAGAVITADSAFWTTGTWGTGIRAFKGGYANFFELNWATPNDISVGAKVLDIANYGFTFLKGSDTYTCTANQNLNITVSASDKIDGNFNVPVTGGTITNISATFTGLPKH